MTQNKKLLVYITPNQKAILDAARADTGLAASEIVRQALDDYLPERLRNRLTRVTARKNPIARTLAAERRQEQRAERRELQRELVAERRQEQRAERRERQQELTAERRELDRELIPVVPPPFAVRKQLREATLAVGRRAKKGTGR
jgi:hypothetical protein